MKFDRLFRIFITFLVFGFYIALVFFSFRQDWKFLLTWEYWVDTSTATGLALMFRWLYSDSGVSKEVETNQEIKDLENGKKTQVGKVNSNNLTDVLQTSIEQTNKKNKKDAYITKCDKHISNLREKGFWKVRRKARLEKWRERKRFALTKDFNVDTVRVSYYRYDLDEMLCTYYKQPNTIRTRRITKNQFVVSSLRTNIVTLLAIMIYNALEVLRKGYSEEDLVVLFGKLIIFSVNIYTGFNLGRDFIKNVYSSNLTDDYAYLKKFLKDNGVE